LNGFCFLDTVNLDGESNLKVKKCHPITQKYTEQQIFSLKGTISCDLPNDLLDIWDGFLLIQEEDSERMINFEY
jgi:hypothetical protein